MGQGVPGPIHKLGHTLYVLIFLCDSDFIWNDRVGDFTSDHAVIIANWTSPDQQPPLKDLFPITDLFWYHKICTDQFHNELYNIPFVSSPVGTASELNDQYMNCLIYSAGQACTIHLKGLNWVPVNYCCMFKTSWLKVIINQLYTHNTFTQFYLKNMAWADSELFRPGPVVAAQ